MKWLKCSSRFCCYRKWRKKWQLLFTSFPTEKVLESRSVEWIGWKKCVAYEAKLQHDIFGAFQHQQQCPTCPCPPPSPKMLQLRNLQNTILCWFSLQLCFSSYGESTFLLLRRDFSHFSSSHFITQIFKYQKHFWRFFRLVASSGISNNDNRSRTMQLWVICPFPITFQIDLSGFGIAFTTALKNIQMYLSCWNNLVLRFLTHQPVVCPK